MKIVSTSKIGDILNVYPETYDVFTFFGFKSDSASELIKNLGPSNMIKTVLKVKEIDETIFLSMINESIGRINPMDQIGYDFHNPDKPLNILVKTACPISAVFKDKLSEVVREQKNKTGKETNCYFVGGCDVPHEYDNFWECNSVEELPDVIMSMGFDEIYDKRFIDKFIGKGNFENLIGDMKQEYIDIGCYDDDYTLNSGLVIGLLIDEKKLGNLPKPKRWEDLFSDIYKNKIIGFGSETEGIFEYPLYYIHKEFGLEGIKKLAENIKHIYHGSKMAKIAGSNSTETEAIHIVPLTFSKLCKNEGTSIVIPEDGGMIIPISFIFKKSKKEELSYLADLLVNDYGQMCSDINGISLNVNLKGKTKDNLKLKWLGWDYIKTNDILSLGEQLKKEFHKTWNRKKQ